MGVIVWFDYEIICTVLGQQNAFLFDMNLHLYPLYQFVCINDFDSNITHLNTATNGA